MRCEFACALDEGFGNLARGYLELCEDDLCVTPSVGAENFHRLFLNKRR